MSMMLLPPMPGLCPVCCVDHAPELPHNRNSFYYQARFNMMHGRLPTWADAIAHCTEEVRGHWERELAHRGMWEQPEGGPISEHPDDAQEAVRRHNEEVENA